MLDYVRCMLDLACHLVHAACCTERLGLLHSGMQYSNIHGVSYMAKQEQNFAALNAFCIYFKTFKYLHMMPGERRCTMRQAMRGDCAGFFGLHLPTQGSCMFRKIARA
jgi:hypothetical protein